MANLQYQKRTSTPGKIPATGDFPGDGSILLNTYDGKLFIRQNQAGALTVIDVIAVAGALGASTAPVQSVNSSTGNVTISLANLSGIQTSSLVYAGPTTGSATPTWRQLGYADITGVAPIASPTFTGTVSIPTATISGGTINSTSIGATTASTGKFTTLTVGTSLLTLGGALTTSGAFATTITVTAATAVTLPTSGTLVSAATVAATYAPIASPTFTGTVTIPTLSVSGNSTLTGTLSVTGGINSTPIGATTASTGAFTTISASGSLAVNGGLVFGSATAVTGTVTSFSISTTNVWNGFGLVAPALSTVGPVTLTTNAATTTGNVLNFASTTGIANGMVITGTNVPAGTTVSSFTTTTVTMSASVTSTGVATSASILFLNITRHLSLADLNANSSYLSIYEYRNATGTNWTTASKRIQLTTDSTYQGFIEFNPSGYNVGLALGQGTPSSSTYGFYMSTSGAITLPVSLTLSGTGITLSVTNNATIGGTLGVTGAVTITGGLSSAAGINSTIIGATTAAAGTFTTLTATAGTLNGISIGATTASTGKFTTLTVGTSALTLGGALTTSGAFATTITVTGTTSVTLPTSGTLAITASPTFTGTVTIPTAAISGGTINSTSIGATTASTGVFTTLTVGSGALVLGGNLTLSGAFATTITVTAATSITLPTSGTLISAASVAATYAPIATPTFTGTVTIPTLTVSGNSTVGGTLAVSSVLSAASLYTNYIRVGGGGANIGGYTGTSIASSFSLDNTALALFAWNYTNSSGELDLIINRATGLTSGLNIYDLASTTHVMTNIFALTGAGALTIPSTMTSVGLNASSNPLFAISPTANPTGGVIYSTYASIVSQGTTVYPTNREWQAIFGLTSNTGGSATNNNGDKVTLYAGLDAYSGTGSVWAINSVVTMNSGSGTYDAQGYELDFNNLSVAQGTTNGPAGFGTGYITSGFSVTGGSAYLSHTAMFIGGVSDTTQWTRGLTIFNGVNQCAIADYSNAANGIQMIANHSGYAIDMLGSTLTNGAFRIPNGTYMTVRNAANTADNILMSGDSHDNMLFSGTGTSAIFFGAIVAPFADNTFVCGTGYNRWSAIYSTNGTIQTSDATLKKNFAALPTVSNLIRDINPTTYQWISGGRDRVEVEEEQLVHETETLYHDTHEIQIIDGVATHLPIKRAYVSEVYEEVPVYDAKGDPVHMVVPATAAILNKDDTVATPAQPETRVHKMHRVPKMVKKTVTTHKLIERPGSRTHWGFLAGDIKKAFDKHLPGVDFGGYVKDEKGVEHMRPDQMLSVAWKGLQEALIRLDAVESELAALKNKPTIN